MELIDTTKYQFILENAELCLFVSISNNVQQTLF